MATLLAPFEIPVPFEPLVPTPSMFFSRWIPVAEADSIGVDRDGKSLRLWFDVASTLRHEAPVDLMAVEHVHRVLADVATAIPDDLGRYMSRRNHRNSAPPEDQTIQNRYDQLVKNILLFVLEAVNRLFTYVTSVTGQYWILEYALDLDNAASYCITFKATARIDDGDWIQFRPSNIVAVSGWIPPPERAIRRDQWRSISIQTFVASTTARAPLAKTLLAQAETLQAERAYRAALTESITALEVAIHSFARRPNTTNAFGSGMSTRLGVAALKEQVEHMGLTGSVRYLLPAILPESVLPQETITLCRDAVDKRGDVVHEGQREIESKWLRERLAAIRQMCDILGSLTMTAHRAVSRPVRQPDSAFTVATPRC